MMRNLTATTALVIVAVNISATAPAATYVVDPRHPAASDNGPGSTAKPFMTIGAAASVAAAGDVVTIRPGVYREWVALTRSGTIDRPITFQAEKAGSVVVTGADPLTGWVREPGEPPVYSVAWGHDFIINTTRRADGTVVYQRNHGADPPLGNSEQVIWDGRPMQQVLLRADLRPGTFLADWDRDRLLVWLPDGRDPNQTEVLASTRSHQFSPLEQYNRWSTAQYITVRGLVFRYAANFAQRGGVRTDTGWRIEDCTVEWNNAGAVNVMGDHAVLLRVTVQDNGFSGIGGGGKDILIKDCVVRRNNRKGFPVGWDGGGGKFVGTDGLRIEGHTSYGNTGPGIWLDWDNTRFSISGCTVYANYGLTADWEGLGIFIEASGPGRVAGNVVYSNTGAGIGIAESREVVVEDNTLVDNAVGLELRAMEGRDGHELTACSIRRNRFAAWRSQFGGGRGAAIATSLGTWNNKSAIARKLSLDGDFFDSPRGAVILRWGSEEFITLNDVRSALALEKTGALEQIAFSRRLVDSKVRSLRHDFTIDRAIASAKIGDVVTIRVNGRTSIRGDRVQLFDLANRYITLSLPDADIRGAAESVIAPYPVSEPVLVKIRLTQIAPATDLRAVAIKIER
jgi:parallel beta-helix repeat protein